MYNEYMNTATYPNIRGFGQSLAKSREELRLRQGLMALVKAIILLGYNERASKKMIAVVRAAMTMCQHSCVGGNCLAGYAPEITSIRDNYLGIAEQLERLPFAFMFRKQVAESLAEWDDLAEDCAIGGDAEIRQALSEIADRL